MTVEQSFRPLILLVEGQTERDFTRDVLAPALALKRIAVSPVILTTSRSSRGAGKGGVTSYERARRDLDRLIKQHSHREGVLFSTMFDLFRLPAGFPESERARTMDDPYGAATVLEHAFADDVGDARFLPYIQIHEFEALLLTDVTKFAVAHPSLSPSQIARLQEIRASAPTPEHVNRVPGRNPAARIRDVIPAYDKRADGPRIARAIGLDRLRSVCKHFGEWLEYLEKKMEAS